MTTKFVALPEYITRLLQRWSKSRLSMSRKASVLNSLITSKCTARVEKQINKQTQAFIIGEFFRGPDFNEKGPA